MLVLCLKKKVYYKSLNVCVIFIAKLLRRVGRLVHKPVKQTSFKNVVIPTERP